MTSAAEALGVVVDAFVEQLAASGVRHVCACPGSRSTPLAIKLAEHRAIKLWMHLDERSAGYFGLGLARALREPVGLLATSGTAAANFLPAVVEASLGRVPLVVLTADRPHELRDNGAPQSIDQVHLYGRFVRWFFDLPEPDGRSGQARMVSALAARAVDAATAEPAGPVHLNWPFREPLVPAPTRMNADTERLAVRNAQLAPAAELVTAMSRDLAASPRGLIVCGPQDDPYLARSVARLARRRGYPVLADPLSGARHGRHDRSLVIDAYDAFLRDPAAVARLAPEVVLRIGALPTSKPLQQYLAKFASARQSVVDPGGWREPLGIASDVLHVDPRLLCEAVSDVLPERPGATEWASAWLDINAAARRALGAYLSGVDELFEGKVFAELGDLLPDGSLLFAGNSMPVRDLDSFLAASDRALRCLANRGANGIDGVVSSALGASAAQPGRVVLVIGDISLYHDLNGLLAARQHRLDLLIVLLNNDGGGIFSFLPQAEALGESFERLFGTPHGLDFRPLVEGYGGSYERVRDWSEFRAAVGRGLAQRGLHVIEVPTERVRNVELHRAAWRAVAEACFARSPAAVC